MEEKISKSYERYLQGMALQEGGASAAEIAQAIGLKDAAAWYSTRAYHGGRKLAQRAVPRTENAPEPAAILEGINCERTAPRAMPLPGPSAVQMLNAECEMLNAKDARKIGKDIAAGLKAGASSPVPAEIPIKNQTTVNVSSASAADAMSAWAAAAREVLRLGAVTPDQIRSSFLPEGTDDERYCQADEDLQGYEKALNAMLEDEKPRRVAVLRMVCAEGERVRYRLQDGQVNIHAKGQKRCALALSIEEARCMILELTDFLAQTEAMA